ncbi:hypothetical protein [Chitinophaga nivalis]|uniref:Uncharacterized protein n=1 Tax=Chitinophaga nivalis TaxID=2991709 RepID=A0ABT3IN77_9BACT|nr:hypothetical protein [Chitinophaga nivalis]MCW3464876.1 hypothetical protein [Chitinophaga nivalis]MCW3485433.1 hypothetical protein [Chitinophaga nivalis]
MGKFHIKLHHDNVTVERRSSHLFSVHLPEKVLHLQLKEDNEGASHWFEEGKDDETPENAAIGLVIETYLNNENPAE